jgi:hypothetical protein
MAGCSCPERQDYGKVELNSDDGQGIEPRHHRKYNAPHKAFEGKEHGPKYALCWEAANGMKANQKPETDEPLRQVLRQWAVDTPLPPRFQEQVWRRIARAEAGSTAWGRLLRLVEAGLPRPRVALAYLAALLILGMSIGSWAAQAKTSHLNADLGLRYVQSIDPYRAGAPQP